MRTVKGEEFFSVPGVVFVLVWFIGGVCLFVLSVFVLTFVCLLANLVLFPFVEDGGATGMGVNQEWGHSRNGGI